MRKRGGDPGVRGPVHVHPKISTKFDDFFRVVFFFSPEKKTSDFSGVSRIVCVFFWFSHTLHIRSVGLETLSFLRNGFF